MGNMEIMKIIELTQGQKTVVDDEDYEFLLQFTWHAVKSSGNKFYAKTKIRDKHRKALKSRGLIFKYSQYVSIHDLLCSIPDNYTVDHIDRNGLNNQKYNLRLCTQQQNTWNRDIRKDKKYKGIVEYKSKYSFIKPKYTAYIQGKSIGEYSSEEEAARKYDTEAIKRFGEFACTNFPKEEYEIHSVYS
jgi:hypothetical protein